MASTRVTPARMQTDSREVNQLQSNLINAFTSLTNQLVATPANGQFITQDLKSGSNTIKHTLGAVPQGYIITSQNASANFFLVTSTDNTLTLSASAPVTVTLFTF